MVPPNSKNNPARQRPRCARTYNASVKTSSDPRISHGNQSHFPHYVRESGQGLRGLRPQSESWRAVRIHRGRGAAVRRALLGGPRPRGGADQGRIFRREAHLSAHAFDPAHRRSEEARPGQDPGAAKWRQRRAVSDADVFDAAGRQEVVGLGESMLQIPGPPALSAFRIAKLLDRLGAREPAVTGLAARFMHFADLAQPLSAPEREVLAELLSYGPRMDAPLEAGTGECVLVVPRAGTISPWSSKATDIARVCGLQGVRRIERGIEYRVRAARPLGNERLARLAPVLFDRMTEMALLDGAQAARLFAHAQPQPLARVSLTGGRAGAGGGGPGAGRGPYAGEVDYLLASFARMGRDPSDVELMM